MPYVYILYSKSFRKYYIGRTGNINRRMEEHNAGRSRYTKNGRPWELVYSEKFFDNSGAAKREIEIKKRKSKKYIKTLIQSTKLSL